MFNLYFAGTQNKASEQVIEDNKNLRLLSYLNDKRHIARRIEKKLPTFVDSGAYSAHTKGIIVDIDDYISYLNENDEFISIAAELDHIPGRFRQPKTHEDLAKAPEISWENYLYMRERVKSPDKILPIYHQGEDFKHLKRILEFEPKIPYIGISPANDVSSTIKEKWIEKVFEVIKASSNPNVKTHAFGMTSLHILEKYPFTSADSTSWIMTGANGGVMTKYGIVTMSDKSTKDPKHFIHMPTPIVDELTKYFDSKGYTPEELAQDYKKRINFNISYLTDWATNYEYKPKPVRQIKLF